MFTGGAVGRMAIFALGIMPYITASIIIQLLTSMVPYLEQLKKEGEQGRKKINQYTRYGTVVLAFFPVLWHSCWYRKSRAGVGSWDVFSSFLCDHLGWWNHVFNVAR
jgi:preprotein translocase subunit SecY